MKKDMAGLICSNPDCIHNGKIQPVDNFYKHSSTKSGYESKCKDCKKESIKNHYKNAEKAKHEVVKTGAERVEINIDFSYYPKILDGLIKEARDEVRSPEHQIIYILKQRGVK